MLPDLLCGLGGGTLRRLELAISHPSLDSLPPVFTLLAPELCSLSWPGEHLADCDACPLVPGPGRPTHSRQFAADVRCCSYYPKLPNFLVGKILLEGGSGRELMRARVTRGPVLGIGVHPPEEWMRLYESDETSFGQSLSIRCPYWVGGTRACGIWRSRGAVCRTWHCRHVDGRAGSRLWSTLRLLLAEIERQLALYCCRVGRVPPEGSGPQVWIDWYEWCARRVATLGSEDIERIRRDGIEPLRKAVRNAHEGLSTELPETPAVNVGRVEPIEDGRIRLSGHNSRDGFVSDRRIFELLSRLDGTRPWSSALEQARSAGAEVDEATVRELWRTGILVPPLEDGDQAGEA